jgi:hypothetical protein
VFAVDSPLPGGGETGVSGVGEVGSGFAADGASAGEVFAGGVVGDAFAGGLAGACGPNCTFLCLGGVSGSTKGPFCPHPTSILATQTAIPRCTILMVGVYRLPQHGSLAGTSGTASLSESAVL